MPQKSNQNRKRRGNKSKKHKPKKQKNRALENDWWRKCPKPESTEIQVAPMSKPSQQNGSFMHDLHICLNMPRRLRDSSSPSIPNYLASIIRSFIPIYRNQRSFNLNPHLGYGFPFLTLDICPITSEVIVAGMNIPPLCLAPHALAPEFLCGATWRENGIHQKYHKGIVRSIQKNSRGLILFTLDMQTTSLMNEETNNWRGVYSCQRGSMAQKINIQGKVIDSRSPGVRKTNVQELLHLNPLVALHGNNQELFILTNKNILIKTNFNQYELKCEYKRQERLLNTFFEDNLGLKSEDSENWLTPYEFEQEPFEVLSSVRLPFDCDQFLLVQNTNYIIAFSKHRIVLIEYKENNNHHTLNIIQETNLGVELSIIKNMSYKNKSCLLLHSLRHIITMPTNEFIQGILQSKVKSCLEKHSAKVYSTNMIMDLPLMAFDSKKQQVVIETNSRELTWIDIY